MERRIQNPQQNSTCRYWGNVAWSGCLEQQEFSRWAVWPAELVVKWKDKTSHAVWKFCTRAHLMILPLSPHQPPLSIELYLYTNSGRVNAAKTKYGGAAEQKCKSKNERKRSPVANTKLSQSHFGQSIRNSFQYNAFIHSTLNRESCFLFLLRSVYKL